MKNATEAVPYPRMMALAPQNDLSGIKPDEVAAALTQIDPENGDICGEPP